MINKNKKLTNNIKFNKRKEINKMKTRIFTICILVAALTMFAPVANADFKVTGGGWIPVFDENDNEVGRASFGLNIKCGESDFCSGNVQFNDHHNNIKIHSTDIVVDTPPSNDYPREVYVTGFCKIQSNGSEDVIGEYSLYVIADDWEDLFGIGITGSGFNVPFIEPTALSGGNINIKIK